jgi:tRNA A-37 threonylcarbamoyl transferase component Bud32
MSEAPDTPALPPTVPRIAGHVQGRRFVKRREFAGSWRQRLRVVARLRPSKARREARCYAELQRLGVPCPQGVEVREWRNAFGLLRGSEISMEYLPKTADLRFIALLPEFAALRADRAWRRAVVDELARWVRHLHDHDFFPQNLHFRNVLVEPDPARRPPSLYVIDCVSGRYGRWGWRRRKLQQRDLAFLYKDARAWCPAKERVRFAHRYFGVTKLTAAQRALLAGVVRDAQAKWGDRTSTLGD